MQFLQWHGELGVVLKRLSPVVFHQSRNRGMEGRFHVVASRAALDVVLQHFGTISAIMSVLNSELDREDLLEVYFSEC